MDGNTAFARNNRGRIQAIEQQTKYYIAHQKMVGRYQQLTYFPRHEIIGDLHNFILGQSASAALVIGSQGSGKTSLACYMAESWQERGHLVMILESGEISAKTLRKILPLVPVPQDKRCILILPKVEEHTHFPRLFAYVQDFLKMYGNPANTIRLLVLCDADIFKMLWADNLFLLPIKNFYRPHACASSLHPCIIEIPPLTTAVASQAYLLAQGLPPSPGDPQESEKFHNLSSPLKTWMCEQPIWIRFLACGRDWQIPPQIRKNEILHNYLDQTLVEHPRLYKIVQTMLPCFEQYQIPFSKLGEVAAKFVLTPGIVGELEQKSILDQRIMPDDKTVLAFVFPIVRDFLIANYLLKKSNMQDVCDNLQETEDTHGYHPAAWAIALSLIQNGLSGIPKIRLTEKKFLSYLMADGLYLFDEILGHSAQVQPEKLRIWSHFLGHPGREYNPLLILFEKIGQYKRHATFVALHELISSHLEELPHRLCLKFLRTATHYYQQFDSEQSLQWGCRWLNCLEEPCEPKDKRDAAHALAQIYLGLQKAPDSLAMAMLALRISEKYREWYDVYDDLATLGDIYEAQQNTDEARNIYIRMAQVTSDIQYPVGQIEAHYRLARLEKSCDRIRAVSASYLRIGEIIENNGNEPWQKMRLMREEGDFAKSLGQKTQAQEYYQKALVVAQELSAIHQAAEIQRQLASL